MTLRVGERVRRADGDGDGGGCFAIGDLNRAFGQLCNLCARKLAAFRDRADAARDLPGEAARCAENGASITVAPALSCTSVSAGVWSVLSLVFAVFF